MTSKQITEFKGMAALFESLFTNKVHEYTFDATEEDIMTDTKKTYLDVLELEYHKYEFPNTVEINKLKGLNEMINSNSWEHEKYYSACNKPIILEFLARIPLKTFFDLTDNDWDYSEPFANNFHKSIKKIQTLFECVGFEPSKIKYWFIEGGTIMFSWKIKKPVIIKDHSGYLCLLVEWYNRLKQTGIPKIDVFAVNVNVVNVSGYKKCIPLNDLFQGQYFELYGNSLDHLSYGLIEGMEAHHSLNSEKVRYTDYENLDEDDYIYSCVCTLSYELHDGVKKGTYHF